MQSPVLRAAPVLSKAKYIFFKKLILHTILGGYLFSDEESGIDLTLSFHIFQFALYVFFPLVVFICGMISSTKDKDFIIGGVIPAAINSVVNIIIQVIGVKINKEMVNTNLLLIGSNTKQFCQIIKPKSLFNQVYSILAMAAISFLASNFIGKCDGIGIQILTLITCLTSFYTLVSSSPCEFSATSSENQELSHLSTAHMRTHYFLILLIINLCLDLENNNIVFRILIPLLPLLWMLGLLGNIYNTFIYAIEKFSSYILGASETSSKDVRLILSVCIKLIVILIISLIVNNLYSHEQYHQKMKLATVLTSICAFILALNFMFSVALEKSQKQYQVNAKYFYPFSLFPLALSVIFPLIFPRDDSVSAGRIICLISLIVLVITFISQKCQSAYISAKLSKSSDKVNRFLCIIQFIVNTAAVSQLGINSAIVFKEFDFTNFENTRIFIQVLLLFRMFHIIYSNPEMTGILLSEIYVYSVVHDSRSAYLLIFSPLLHAASIAASNVIRRLFIWVYSVIRMNNSKKQKINQQTLFNILSFTLFLPVNLLGIILSSALDTPFLPFLGLPLYFCSFLKPKRGCPQVKRVVKQSGESLLYSKFVDNFQGEFSKILRKKNVSTGEFFLIRIEKYLATVQILENGQNYVVAQVRGLESQEMTSCHSIESNQVDRITEEIYQKGNCFFNDWFGSLKPLQMFNVKSYEENNLQFTGIITDSGFVKGYKELLLKCLVYFINEVITIGSEEEEVIDQLLSLYGDYIQNQQIHKEAFPNQFAQFIGLDITKKKNKSNYNELISDLHFNINAIGANPASKSKNNQNKSDKKQQQKFTLDEDLNDFASLTQQPQNLNKNMKQEVNNLKSQNQISDKHTQIQPFYPTAVEKLPQNAIPQKISQQKQSKEEKKILADASNNKGNDLDDLLDNLSIKSLQKNKQQIKVPLSSANNPFNLISKAEVDIKQTKKAEQHPKPELNIEMMKEDIQLKFLSHANKAIVQQDKIHQEMAPQLISEQFTIQPKKDNEEQKGRGEKHLIKNPKDHDELDNYLSNLLGDDDGVKRKPESKTNNNTIPLSPSNLDKNSNNQSNNLANIEKEDDIDNFLAEFTNDHQNLRPKAQAPPMMLNLEDDEFPTNKNDMANIKQPGQRTPPKISQSQTNTRVSGHYSSNNLNNIKPQIQENSIEKVQKLVFLLYSLMTNDNNYDKTQIDQELLFKNFKDVSYLKQLRLFKLANNKLSTSKILFVANQAIRYAIKVAYDTFAIMGSVDDMTNEDVLEAINENIKDCQIGMGNESSWKKAIDNEVNILWQLHFSHSEQVISIFRSQFKEISCSSFQLDEHVVTSIWANLAFELYYATNNDDERYSIQTHEQFFRNLIIQSAEEPLGYSPYYSGPILIYY